MHYQTVTLKEVPVALKVMDCSRPSSSQDGSSPFQHDRYDSTGSVPTETVDQLRWRLFAPVRRSLDALKNVTKEEVPDTLSRESLIRKKLAEIGGQVMALTEDPETPEDDEVAVW